MIGAVFEALAANRTRRRRARNLRAGGRARTCTHAGAGMAAATPTDTGVRTAGPGLAARLAGALARPRMPVLRKPGPLAWLTLAVLLLAAAGAWVIATHARWLAAAGVDAVSPQLAVLQPALRDLH